MLFQNGKTNSVIGVDIGGTKTAVGLVDSSGALIAVLEDKTPVEGGFLAVEHLILDLIEQLIDAHSVSPLAVGVGVAGQVDLTTNTIMCAPNLFWKDVSLSAHLSNSLKIPVWCLNDVRAATLAEWFFGAGKNQSDFICAFIGTGIGAGIVSGGHLLTGCGNTFGEIGHMVIDPRGALCNCGRRGCFEALAGGRAIAIRAREKVTGNTDSILLQKTKSNFNALTTRDVVSAYRLHDTVASEIINEVKENLILGFSNLVNICNPSLLILGGGLIQGMPELVSIIKEGILKTSLKAATRSFDVVKAVFENYAGVIGSATAVFHFLQGKKL